MTEVERRALRGLVATLLGQPTEFDAAALPVTLVRRHLLAPLAYKAGVVRFRDDFIASALQAERRRSLLDEVLSALTIAGIEPILLKGIAYAGTIYADPAERPMSDVDLLFKEPDVEPAVRALHRLGFWHAGGSVQLTVTRHALTLKRREASIDVHRNILHAGRSRIDLPAIWRGACASHVPNALRPMALHEYLLHVAHIGRHEGMVPIINYVDASRLAQTLPRDDVHQLAVSWSVSKSCAAVEHALADLRLVSKRAQDRWTFPTTEELLTISAPPRWLQVIRKVRTVDDVRGVTGLVAATVRSRLAPLRSRRG